MPSQGAASLTGRPTSGPSDQLRLLIKNLMASLETGTTGTGHFDCSTGSCLPQLSPWLVLKLLTFRVSSLLAATGSRMAASMLVALGAALVPLALMAPPEAALQQQVIDQNSLAYMGNRWEIDHLQNG